MKIISPDKNLLWWPVALDNLLKRTFCVLGFIFPSEKPYSLMAQTQQLLPTYCASDSLSYILVERNPHFRHLWRNAIAQAQDFTGLIPSGSSRDTSALFTIPVVVHIIHNDGAENISPAQVWNGIDILTRNFRKRNPDTSEIVPFFKPLAADCRINFILARRDPNGQCHPGYTRIRSEKTQPGDHSVKDLIHWPRDRYLNIYVTRDAAGLAGHALMPFQADSLPQWDGIVIRYDYYGNIGSSNDVKSVVLTHEAGHYLNLFHVWGGNNVPGFYYLPVGQPDNCSYDDDVTDTPNTIGWSQCNLNANSCDSLPDNVQNFMDYAYCARMFTQGQAQRMHDALQAPVAQRNLLSTPQNLQDAGLNEAPQLCAARAWVPRRIACIGQPLAFYDDSYHGAVSWFWEFGDGSTSTQRHPTHTYNESGTYTISLTVSDGQNTLTYTAPALIRINPPSGLPLPYARPFDDQVNDFHEELDGTVDVDLTSEAAWSAPYALRMGETFPASRGRIVLTSPPLNLANTQNPAITLRYAFARRDTTNRDRLVLKISRDCGATWVTRFSASGEDLETTSGPQPGPFVPVNTDWRQVTVSSIPSIFKTDGFLFRLEYYPDGGHDLWLDDVWVDEAANLQTKFTDHAPCRIYPNPVGDRLYSKECNLKPGQVVSLISATGAFRYLQVEQDNSVDLNALPPGVWLIQTDQGTAGTFLKIIKF
jgi:PKD repeat protein